MRVVLDFPQSFIETFPFVGLPVFVLVLLIREEVLGAQKCPVGYGQSKEETEGFGEKGMVIPHCLCPRLARRTSQRWHLRLVGAEKEYGVFVGGRLHSPINDVVNLGEKRGRQQSIKIGG